MQPTPVLATLSGRDRPGVVASVFAALAAHDVEVRDVEQMVINERLVLTVLLDVRGDPPALRGSLSRAAAALGMDSEVVITDSAGKWLPEQAAGAQVLLLGRLMRPGALAHVAQQIADLGANIESVTKVADHPTSALELLVRAPSPAQLRATLVRTALDIGFDVAVQPAALARRAKRLVLLDVSATLLPTGDPTPFDVLVEQAGAAGERAAIARQQAAGDIDSAAALRAKANLLAGLREEDLRRVGRTLPLSGHAREGIATLQRLGYRVGAICADFGFGADRLVAELGVDFVRANELEVRDGVVTGRVVEPLVDRAGKAAALVRFAEQHRVPMSQTVAVGAGADDLELLLAAGLALVCTGASSPLDSVLFVLGALDASQPAVTPS